MVYDVSCGNCPGSLWVFRRLGQRTFIFPDHKKFSMVCLSVCLLKEAAMTTRNTLRDACPLCRTVSEGCVEIHWGETPSQSIVSCKWVISIPMILPVDSWKYKLMSNYSYCPLRVDASSPPTVALDVKESNSLSNEWINERFTGSFIHSFIHLSIG